MRGPHQPGGDGLLSLHLLTEHAQSMVFRYRLVPPRGFEYVSPSVTALTGYTPAEYYADPELAFKLVHPEDHHVLQAILEGKFVNPVVLRFVRKNGAVIWMEQRHVTYADHAGEVVAVEGIARDVTERKATEAALAADARFLRAQTEVAAVASSDLHSEVLIPRLLEAIVRTQGYAYGALWRLTKSRRKAVITATIGDNTDSYLGFRLPLSDPQVIVAQSMRTGEPVFCNQVQAKPVSHHPLYRALRPQAVLALPLTHRRGVVVGALSFGDAADAERFSERDLTQGAILARQVAQAIENCNLCERFQRLEEQYRALTASVPYALYMANREGRVTFGNAALARLTGYQLEDLIGHPSTRFYAPAAESALRERRKRAARGESALSQLDVEVRRKDGVHIPVQLSLSPLTQRGKVTGHVCVIRDVAERKHAAAAAERRRRESEVSAELIRMLNASLELDAVLLRAAEGARELCTSDAAIIALREPASEALVIRHLVGGSHRACMGLRIAPGQGVGGQVLSSGCPFRTDDYVNDRRLSGDFTPLVREHGVVCVMAVPIRVGARIEGLLYVYNQAPRPFSDEDEGTLLRLADHAAIALANAHLYQELQRAYDKLSHTRDQLIHAQKMEAVGRLAGGIAHDFNNLLTVIMGRADLVLTRLRGRARLRRHLELILGAADSAASLTRQLLAFSRRQVLLPEVTDLNTVVINVQTMLQWLIGEDIQVHIQLGQGLGRVKADPGQLEQVVMNLAVNARDAMRHGGRLTIETSGVELDEAYAREHLGAQPGRYVRLRVQDTGCGMSPETQAHIFEPFFTTKEPGQGTGLGLSTVYGIVTQSGGTISVTSAPGEGATFTIDLPRIEDPCTPAPPNPPQNRLPPGTETVLLVEDEATVRSVAREVFQIAGYTVLEAATGEEALEQAARHAGVIHLLVTDVVMPGMNGRELADRLAVGHPALEVLYLSGYTDDAIARHGVLGVGVELLRKPFTPETLARRAREILDKKVARTP